MNADVQGNPVGTIQDLQSIEAKLQELLDRWAQLAEAKPAWWSFAKRGSYFYKSISFMINSLDETVQFVDKLVDSGEDKKATVLAVLAILYDKLVVLPLWMQPMALGIRTFLIYGLFSLMIDFVVAKYRNSEWTKEEPKVEEPVVEAPAEPVVEAPAEPVVEAPAEPVVEAPAEPVVEAPAEPVVEAPAEPVVEAPAEPVVEAPAEPVVEAPAADKPAE